MMNQGDRAGDIVAAGVVVDYAAAEVLHLWWLLWGGLICDDEAEIVMVGGCWHNDVMYFYIVSTSEKMSRLMHQDSA
jgi:hypothetical protein